MSMLVIFMMKTILVKYHMILDIIGQKILLCRDNIIKMDPEFILGAEEHFKFTAVSLVLR